jgi:hypothetical protein
MKILGIDPGANTGVALFLDGQLIDIGTTTAWTLRCFLDNDVGLVVLEDSTLQSHVWTPAKGAAALKIARNIGEIDAWCKLIKAECGSRGIAYRSISPKEKGAKLTADEFKKLTGWTGKSNQHERDAAMVAWRFRNTRESR